MKSKLLWEKDFVAAVSLSGDQNCDVSRPACTFYGVGWQQINDSLQNLRRLTAAARDFVEILADVAVSWKTSSCWNIWRQMCYDAANKPWVSIWVGTIWPSDLRGYWTKVHCFFSPNAGWIAVDQELVRFWICKGRSLLLLYLSKMGSCLLNIEEVTSLVIQEIFVVELCTCGAYVRFWEVSQSSAFDYIM